MKSQTWLEGLKALEATHARPFRAASNLPADVGHPLHTLVLAQALLQKPAADRDLPRSPQHIAVIGPTQAGKSSLINALLQTDCARPSPLAGFTRHAQGFVCQPQNMDSIRQSLVPYFAPASLLPASSLADHQDLECWSLAAIETPSAFRAENLVVWDTPDFDSLEASAYRTALFKVIALADLCLLVLSKEKYADQSVWHLIRLLQPLGIPTLVCINKVPDGYETMLRESFSARWHQIRQDRVPPLITLPYEPQHLAADPGIERLRMLLQRETGTPSAMASSQAFRHLRDCHWEAWLAPLLAEETLQTQWQQQLEQQARLFLECYEKAYLQHPLHNTSFQRAMAEMLRLLEIPGIGGPLNQLRQLVTWPARQLSQWVNTRPAQQDHEDRLLQQLAQDFLLGLTENPGQLDETVWAKLLRRLKDEQPRLLLDFEKAGQLYHADFQKDIDATARQLFSRLQQHPALLNSLRATRAATDATALALTLHTGGIGIQDFILAPASLGITSYLTESVLGQYMHHAANQLRQRQQQAVSTLLAQQLTTPLYGWLAPSTRNTQGHILTTQWFETLRQQDPA
ncbi:MAG: hypothetical protein RIQ52_1669 [Pseudomonadota bacterium]